MIPKIIHYCWFGKNKLPNKAKKCIASWKKYLPDYKIKEWNENNFDIKCCTYVQEAYEAGKWAFVSDYARFWILYHEGGLYFDTDVEIIKSIDDIISKGSFMGCEPNLMKNNLDNRGTGEDMQTIVNYSLNLGVNPGLGLGVTSGLGLYKEILNYYESIHFLYENDIVETVVDYTTSILKKHGWKGNGEIEKIAGIYIYPPDFFCPMDYLTGKLNITEHTCSIHWYMASWQSTYSKLKTKVQHLLGKQATEQIIKLKNKFKGK